MQLSEKIALLRKRRGLSQEQLANELDVSRQAIYKWETGQTTPEIEKVKKLSDIFNVSLSDLLNDNVDIREVPIVITNNEEEIPPQEDVVIENELPDDNQGTENEAFHKKKNIFLICLLCSISLIAIVLGIILALVLNKEEPLPTPSTQEPSHACVFGPYEIEIEPSCKKAGLERRYCQECDKAESRAIATIPHSEIVVHGYAATCSVGGLSNGKKCSNCNTVLVEQKATSVDPNNHKEETVYGYVSTCTVQGLSDGKKCADCDKILIEQEKLPLASHKEEETLGYAPTCTKTGLTNGAVCSACDKIITPQTIIEINPEGHTRVTVEGKAPTCVEKGLTDGVKCSECNKVLQGQAEISLTEHTVEIINGYDATCLKDGLTEGKRCSYCKVILVKQQIIVSNGQHIRETTPGYASTCTVAGKSDGVKCAECGEVLVEQEELELAPHTESTTPGYEATCTSTGLKDKVICSVCDYVISEGELIPTIDHSYVDGKCTVCENLEPNIIDHAYTFNLNEDKTSYMVSYYGGGKTDTTIIIPSTYEGLPVTRIEKVDEANSVKKVVLPNTIMHINDGAFLFESSIESINIPNSVVSIGTNAFEGCSSLIYLYIPSSVTSMGAFIAGTELNSGNSMERLIIYCQNGVDTTNWHENWDSYEHVNSTVENPTYLKHTVVYVDSEDDITGGDSYEEEGEIRFILNEDEASYSVTGNKDLQEATSLVIPSEYNGLPVTGVLPYAFNGNTVIEDVFIPSTVKKIDTSAFDGCSNLKAVTISSGVETIMTRAFADTAIENVFIPDTVETMGPAVFDGCNNMKNIFCQIGSQPDFDFEALVGWHQAWTAHGSDQHYCIIWDSAAMGYTEEGFLWVQNGSDAIYIAGYYGNAQSVAIPSSVNSIPVTQISAYAFQGNTVLEQVLITSSVKKVGGYAFDKCSNLKSVTIGAGVEYIGNEAFSETAIEEVFIPSTVAQMGAAIFDGCNSLQNIYCQLDSQPSDWSFLWLVHGSSNHSCVTWGVLENPIE